MATLRERLTQRLRAEQDEKARIEAQYVDNLAAVDARIAAIRTARQAITDDAETAYAALVQLGLIREIE